MLVSFLNVFAGLCGFISILTTIILADILNYDKLKINSGYYSFNSLLIGFGIGLTLQENWVIYFLAIFASILTFFFTIILEKSFEKNSLPFLSLPFLLSFWIILLAVRDLHFINLSEQGLFFLHELRAIGGKRIIGFPEWWSKFDFYSSVNAYFLSLAAIFFQYKIISGILIASALLYYSRIAFSLSVIGFYSAYILYQLIGADFNDLSFSYIGFNYILTAIAIGGYFLIPSKTSYFWVIILTPITLLITLGFGFLFGFWNLYIYSLPFNVVVILFLYALRFSSIKKKFTSEIQVRKNSPEINLYMYLNNNHRFKNYSYFPIRLPFYGEWKVSQAHNGQETHKDKWKHAWDFVIIDEYGKTYNDAGGYLTDYYCYGKAILSPYDGYVEEIIDGVPDNEIKDVNIENNWGNTIIIRHSDLLYSKLCHLKPGSFKVVKGDWVKSGQLLAFCGNSGRSPEPHLHFQMQAVPFIDGETIDYPVSQYLTKNGTEYDYKSYIKPEKNEIVANIEINSMVKKAFHFIPGNKIDFDVEYKGKKKRVSWEIFTDIYNHSYIYCKNSESIAYFVEDGKTFYFYDFIGSRNSLLFYFFLAAYKVPLGFYKNVSVKDTFALNFVYTKPGLIVQDFIAPFFVYLKSNYEIIYKEIDDMINPSKLSLGSTADKRFFGKITGKKNFLITLNQEGIDSIKIFFRKKTINAICIR